MNGFDCKLRRVRVLIVLAAAILIVPVLIVAVRRERLQQPGSAVTSQSSAPLQKQVASGVSGAKIAFVRGGWIHLKDLSSQKETKLVQGINPGLAPSGESLLYLSITENDGIAALLVPPAGRLRLLSLRTGESRVFDSLRETIVGGAVWSEDGKLALTILEKDHKQPAIAFFNPGTGNVEKKITTGWDPLTFAEGIYLDSWVPGTQSVLFHTLTALYEANFDSGLVQKLPVHELFLKGEVSSATRFSLSADQRHLLFDRVIDTAEEPQAGIISFYDFTTKTLQRVTPKNVQARSPVWANNEVLFTKVDYAGDHMMFSLCKISVDGTGLTTVVKNADHGTYAAR